MLGILRLMPIFQTTKQSSVILRYFSAAARRRTPNLPDSNLALLQQYGFTAAHLQRFSIKNVSILSADPEKTIKPALSHLTLFNFSTTELSQIFLANRGLSDRTAPNLKLLEELLGSKEHVKRAVLGAPILLNYDLEKTFLPNLMTLKENGVPSGQVARAVAYWPRGMTMNNDAFREAVTKVKEIGINPSKMNFIFGLRALLGVSQPTWERRMALFQSFGCSEEEIHSAFSRQPLFMARSDEKIKKILSFFAEKLKIDPPFVLLCPEIFGMSLEKRIIPRLAVINMLVSEGLLDKRPSLFGLLTMANSLFEEKFVDKYEKQVPKVVHAFEGKIKFNGFKIKK